MLRDLLLCLKTASQIRPAFLFHHTGHSMTQKAHLSARPFAHSHVLYRDVLMSCHAHGDVTAYSTRWRPCWEPHGWKTLIEQRCWSDKTQHGSHTHTWLTGTWQPTTGNFLGNFGNFFLQLSEYWPPTFRVGWKGGKKGDLINDVSEKRSVVVWRSWITEARAEVDEREGAVSVSAPGTA